MKNDHLFSFHAAKVWPFCAKEGHKRKINSKRIKQEHKIVIFVCILMNRSV